MTTAHLLKAEQMTKRFGGLIAVDRLDLAVDEHRIHSVIGPNGAGKTTVFNCIMNFYPPDTGKVWFNGARVDGVTPDRVATAGINRTYQNIRLFRNLTALENILVGMHIHLKSTWLGAVLQLPSTRHDEREAQNEAVRILDFIGLRGRGDVVSRNLAYGEQRRLEIGRALATKPRLLLLDEVMAGLNPTELAGIIELIRRLHADGLSLIIIEHIMAAMMRLAQRIAVLHHGEKIAEGAPAEITRDRRVVDAYLGEEFVLAEA